MMVFGAVCAPVTATVGAQAAGEIRPVDSIRVASAIADTSGSADTNVVRAEATPRIVSTAASNGDDVPPPPMLRLRAGVHAPETARPLTDQPLASPSGWNLGQARAMMVVGVAALVAGAVIGGTPGTIVMVGGAVIGLVGLYNYLQ